MELDISFAGDVGPAKSGSFGVTKEDVELLVEE